MTDREKREDDKLKKLIHDAYDFSDEQLLAELEEAKATLSDSDFSGIEDRMYQKLHRRLEEETCTDESPEKPSSNDLTAILATSLKRKGDHSKKKKIAMIGLLAAAFVGMLGVTAVGEKNYFFRIYQTGQSTKINNSSYLKAYGKLDDAYESAAEQLNMPIMKMGYMPVDLTFIELGISDGIADFYFKYNKNKVHFVQEKREIDMLLSMDSDRDNSINSVYNEWLQMDICISEEKYEDNENGYSSLICIDNRLYRFTGQIEEQEMRKIVENLYFD